MAGIIFKIIGLLIVSGGVICVYDARVLTGIWFGFGDQNEATSGLKILGFIISILGVLIVYWAKG